MNFRLRLHVESFKFIKDLLEIHPILCQNKDRFIHHGNAHLCLPFSGNTQLHFFRRLGFNFTKFRLHRLRVSRLYIERQVISRHFTIRQDLIDQQFGCGRHQRRGTEGNLFTLRIIGEYYLASRNYFVIEVHRPVGRVDIECNLLPHLSRSLTALLQVNEITRWGIRGLQDFRSLRRLDRRHRSQFKSFD